VERERINISHIEKDNNNDLETGRRDFIEFPIEFKILQDLKLIKLINEYNSLPISINRKQRRYANRGTIITKNFIKFINNHRNLSEERKKCLIEKIICINSNNIIKNCVLHHLRYSGMPPERIEESFKDLGYKISSVTIRSMAHKELSREEYEKIFPHPTENFSEESLEFFVRHKISYTKSKKRWTWLNKKNAPIYFKEIIYPEIKETLKNDEIILGDNEGPTSSQLNRYGYRNFMTAIFNRNIKLSYILNEIGLEPNKKESKWEHLTIEKAVEYFKKILNNDLRERLGLDKNKAPTTEQLIANDHAGFLNACTKKQIRYNELLREARFMLNNPFNRWEGLKIEQAAVYLETILNEGLRDKLSLPDGKGPTMQQLIDNGHNDFVMACVRREITYNNLLREANLDIRHHYNRWKGLTIENAGGYLKNILDNGLKDKLGLQYIESPTILQLVEAGHQDFISAMQKRDISYLEIVENIGLSPNEKDVRLQVGNNFHWIAEEIFVEFFREKGFFSFWEIYPSKYNDKNRLNHCDNSVLIDALFLEKIFPKDIKMINRNNKIINVDYFLSFDFKKIYNKCNKGYQGKEKMLILVSIFSKNKFIPTPKDIPFHNNVLIFNAEGFTDFLGYNGHYLYFFNKAVELARRGIFDRQAFKDLCELAKRSKHCLLTNYSNPQNELETCLKLIKSSNILKNSANYARIDDFF